MTVNLYTVSDSPNVLSKTLGQPTQFTDVDVYDPCDILAPAFLMHYTPSIVNYNYLSAFGRYYFITDMTVSSGSRVVIKCAVDVLTTYADSIKNCTGTILRAENPKTKILRDNKYPLAPDVDFYSWLFPQTPWDVANSGYNYLITTCGGVDNGS